MENAAENFQKEVTYSIGMWSDGSCVQVQREDNFVKKETILCVFLFYERLLSKEFGKQRGKIAPQQ